MVQTAAAVICCCLPTYGPLYQKLHIAAAIKNHWNPFQRRNPDEDANSTNRSKQYAAVESIGGRRYNRFAHSSNNAKDKSWIVSHSEAVIMEDHNFDVGSYPLDVINVERTMQAV